VAQDKDAGWYVRANHNWILEPKGNVQDILVSQGIKRPLVGSLLGRSITNHWKLVNKPFQEEYPGDRSWNMSAAQLIEPRPGDHPHWDKILNHCGHSFISEDNEWCIENGILDGGTYLLSWIASLVQYPQEPLPYIFLYGPQNSGKSILHESLKLLLRNGKGLCRADVALTSQSNFNGEIEGAVLCIVEEVNLQKSKGAYEKIKDWVTGRTITIHKKGQTPYDIENTTHWIHCANDPGFCPIFTGDSRIAMGLVPPLLHPIPKHQLLTTLEEEAPAFLATLLDFELPEPIDRLRIPILDTAEKQIQTELNRNALEIFIDENLFEVPGKRVLLADFCDKFQGWLPQLERGHWSSHKVARSLPPSILRGRMGEENKTYLGNVSFNPDALPEKKLVFVKGRLK
jgi:hypothetical protein